MAFDEELAERVRGLLAFHPGYTEKKMFGGIGFMLNGNMAVGVSGEDLMVRVGVDAYDGTLGEPHVREFDMSGRPMRGWIIVESPGIAEADDLARWVGRGAGYAESLPPK